MRDDRFFVVFCAIFFIVVSAIVGGTLLFSKSTCDDLDVRYEARYDISQGCRININGDWVTVYEGQTVRLEDVEKYLPTPSSER